MRTWLLFRKLTVPGGEVSWCCGALDTEGEAKAQTELLNNDLRAVMSCQIVDKTGKLQGTVRDLLVGLGVTGIAHARMGVEPRSAILIPEKIIIQ